MRRYVFALMMTLLLLCGCSGEQDEEIYERWRQEAAGAKLSFDAEITALAGAEQTVYAVHVDHAGDTTELTLTAPESIAGICIQSRKGEAELCYEGLVLSLFGAASDPFDPCGVVPAWMEALSSPRLRCIGSEGEYLAAELPLEGEKSIRVFFERQSMTPFYMEATENGQCVVFCNIKNWTMGET
ncbi:MAG: hypothetical protein E7442_03975 [Ruminococcaceae bacterium]|nr:hypothetical protein [Oscillospiraceae bacterium]